MAPVWDAVYGKGYFVGNVSGQPQFTHFVMRGDHGTAVTVEHYDSYDGRSATVAQDSKGNFYKVTGL